MNQIHPSIYRIALQVPPERIAIMDDGELNDLMRRLIQAQAYRCGSPINEIRINTEGKASDDGCDGWTGKPTTPDDWLGSTNTCWQFKAGSAGEPARISGEITKPIPQETLKNGGRFVLVASGSTNGPSGEVNRLTRLRSEARQVNIPSDNIFVIGSERLTIWCNQHPAVAAYWAGRPEGLWTLDDWANSEEHRVPFQASETVQAQILTSRKDLDFGVGNVHHLHIQGPPGVGKTRFALELCRDAEWKSTVIYIRQASDFRLLELIDSVSSDPGAELVLVADEVQYNQLRPLRDSIERSSRRVRLISIGHSPSPDPSRIPSLLVEPLGDQEMRKVINGWHPAMPPEHIEFVVRFSDGYIRLARLAAFAVSQNPIMDVRGLLSRDEIRVFLDGMLGTGDRRALYIVAVVDNVGWTEDKQNEGEAISKHFGLDWNWVRPIVEDYHRRLGIVPRGGRYRYISPLPLGIYLAVEAWTTFPELLKTLPDILPSEEAINAYYERLQLIASNPQAREFAREELAFFFSINDFIESRSVRRWSALSSADPDVAALIILKALNGTSIEDRKRIDGSARREAVWTLVRLAWKSSSFHDAIKALALLAEAENETWANNASAEFIARFQIILSGTAVNYFERLTILDELLAEKRPLLASLVVKALAQIGNQQFIRMNIKPASDQLPELEWRPRTNEEYIDCAKAAITKLRDIVELKIDYVQNDLINTAQNLEMMLLEPSLREIVVPFYEDVRKAYPEAREPLRKIIADIIYKEKKYWKKLPSDQIEKLEKLHTSFEDQSLGARLRQFVGQASLEREDQTDLKPLATELLYNLEIIKENWQWLTSGDASDSWRLGEALAEVDFKTYLAEALPRFPDSGRDFRLLSGYICAKRRILGDAWYNRWLKSQAERDPKPVALIFEITWRCGATEILVNLIAQTLRSQQIDPQIVGQLNFGRWSEDLSVDVFETVLNALTDTGHLETAIAILEHRLKNEPTEYNRWKPQALKLVTASSLIRRHQMTSFYWKEVAQKILADHPVEIAEAIFREQANRESSTWFADNNDTTNILLQCTVQNPKGVWLKLQPYLLSSDISYRFSIGFPKGVIERIPVDDIMEWIAEDPENRAPIVALLTSKQMSTDETIASQILGKYGDKKRVAQAFFSTYVSGSFSGPSSAHSEQLALSLDEIAERTTLPKLRIWATKSAQSLRDMAEHERQWEEEQDLRNQ